MISLIISRGCKELLRNFSKVRHLPAHFFTKQCPLSAKDVRFGEPVRAQMLQGVEILANCVGLTMGPKGRNVALEQYKSDPRITKDGVTVSKALTDLRDTFPAIGAKLVIEVADSTNKKAGDGTTTAIVLASSIAKESLASIRKGQNPAEIRKGVKAAVDEVVKQLKLMSRPVTTPDEIKQVAVISSNGDEEISELIATAMEKVGPTGVVTVKEGATVNDEVEIINGLQIENGYISPYFVNTKKGSRIDFKNAYILFCDYKLNEMRSLVPVLELSIKKNKPLLIVAEDVEGDALTTLVINKIRIGLNVCAVKAPSFGEGRTESLKDLAVATGGIVFGGENDVNLIDVKEEHLGKADEVTVAQNETLILKGRGDKKQIDSRAAQIDYLIEKAKNEFIRDGLQERKARLVSGVAVIKIGGFSEIDVNERKDRVVDALNATKAAVEEGIVAGGGTALVKCINKLREMPAPNEEFQIGIHIVEESLRMPCHTIVKNAGEDAAMIVDKVLQSEENVGFDVISGTFVDMFQSGIVDPTKVVRTALTDAASVASMLTATEVVIAHLKESKSESEEEDDKEVDAKASANYGRR